MAVVRNSVEFGRRPAACPGQSLRPLFRTAYVAAVLFPILLTACGYKRSVLTRSDRPGPSPHREKGVATESGPHSEPHLHGWRRTEALFEEAYRTSPDPVILDKLLTTQFLILTRETEEGIYGPFHVKRLSSLCSRGSSSFHETLCQSGRERMRHRHGKSVGRGRVGDSVRDQDLPVETPLLAAYLRLLLTEEHLKSDLSKENPLEALDPDETSPLTLYLESQAGRLEKIEDHVERHPRFAELLFYGGNKLLEKARYTEAIDSMTEAIRLVPEYTKAMVTLGEFHLRSLYLYERALHYFEDALGWDPENISALFGHGVALHLLGRYELSQHSLDRLLELEPAVWNAIPQESRKSFRARSCYWKAKNYYAIGSSEKAREWVDRALADLPRSEPVLYLSGILHLEKIELASARSVFIKVVEGGTELCDAYYQLGVINQSQPGQDILFNFMNNAYCRQRKLTNLKEELNRVEDLDLDSTRKEEVLDVLQNRRDRLREETFALLFNMTERVGSIGELDATVFHQAMEELWDRLSNPKW